MSEPQLEPRVGEETEEPESTYTGAPYPPDDTDYTVNSEPKPPVEYAGPPYDEDGQPIVADDKSAQVAARHAHLQPDNSLPQPPARPDQGLPGPGPGPDQGLPGPGGPSVSNPIVDPPGPTQLPAF